MIRLLLTLSGLPVLLPLLTWFHPLDSRDPSADLPTAVAVVSELDELKDRLNALQARVSVLNEDLGRSLAALEP
jgi:hypothetical protein